MDKELETKEEPKETPTIDVPKDEPKGGAVDVVFDDKGEGTVVEAEADAEKPKPRKRNDIDRRIGKERALRAQAETTAERIMRENETLKAELAGANKKVTELDGIALDNHAARVEVELNAAKKAHREATDSGDATAIAEATATLSTAAINKQRVDDWKAQQKRNADRPDGEPKPKQEPRRDAEQQQRDPSFDAWLDVNPWFEPTNPEYDEDRHHEAVDFATILERRMIRQGRQSEIGSPGYWKQVDAHMAKYDDGDDGEAEPEPEPKPKRGMPTMKRDDNAVPVRSTSLPSGNSSDAGSPTRIRLTQDQIDLANQYVQQGVWKNADGSPLTEKQAQVRFANAIREDAKKHNQRSA